MAIGDDRQNRLLGCAPPTSRPIGEHSVPVERHDATLAGAARLNTSGSLSRTISPSTSRPPSSAMPVAMTVRIRFPNAAAESAGGDWVDGVDEVDPATEGVVAGAGCGDPVSRSVWRWLLSPWRAGVRGSRHEPARATSSPTRRGRVPGSTSVPMRLSRGSAESLRGGAPAPAASTSRTPRLTSEKDRAPGEPLGHPLPQTWAKPQVRESSYAAPETLFL